MYLEIYFSIINSTKSTKVLLTQLIKKKKKYKLENFIFSMKFAWSLNSHIPVYMYIGMVEGGHCSVSWYLCSTGTKTWSVCMGKHVGEGKDHVSVFGYLLQS